MTRHLVLLFLFLPGIIIFFIFYERSPKLFPLDDPDASYWIEQTEGKYTIRYQDGKTTISNVMVGTSSVDLKEYVGRRVRVYGRFRDHPSNIQCIAARCRLLFADQKQKAVVVDIDGVEPQ